MRGGALIYLTVQTPSQRFNSVLMSAAHGVEQLSGTKGAQKYSFVDSVNNNVSLAAAIGAN